ncbi:hypothetical protein NIES4074_17370 [Cylindrospermum sp. NIES-4074]|nr:hypothetical protein NIES4074_17370 [Cylindrospermum sp. NIES-4074]
MGHTRLGSIPKTRKWKNIVSLITGDDSTNSSSQKMLVEQVGYIAHKTLDAAAVGLEKAVNDQGLQYTFYLLTQLALSARQSEWQVHLENIGINLSEDAVVFDLTAEVQNAIDDYLSTNAFSTDISEMAQQAIGEAITTLAGPEQLTLFGSSRDELQTVIRKLSTKKGFAELGQTFFGRFMARFLNFYLSRVTAAQLDENKLHQIGDLSRFNEVLQRHCEQSALIVRDFCGQWYSKTEFQEGINLDNTSNFMAVALKKLQAELERQRGDL